MPTITRSAIRAARDKALAAGETFFTVDAPCVAGHTGPRYSSNGNCQACKEQHNQHRKPENERRMKLAHRDTKVVQYRLDRDTARLCAILQKQLAAAAGRPISGSILHKASIAHFARHLSTNITSAELWSLLR